MTNVNADASVEFNNGKDVPDAVMQMWDIQYISINTDIGWTQDGMNYACTKKEIDSTLKLHDKRKNEQI